MSGGGKAPSARVAIVTGGSRGIGASTVLSLARRGVNCVLTYKRDATAAGRVVGAAESEGARAAAVRLDARDTEILDAFVPTVRQALADLGATRFNYLVNSAGVAHRSPIEATTEEALDLLYEVHYKGVFLLTQKLLPLIEDGGRIVNLSTALTRRPEPGSAVYASMKAAVEVFSRYLAMELTPRCIAVDALTLVESDATADAPSSGATTGRRRPGAVDTIGSQIASLLSQDAR